MLFGQSYYISKYT